MAEGEDGSFRELVELSFQEFHGGRLKGADMDGVLVMRWRCADL